MSMVGYVLGLGDRHPSNLMLDRKSGKVLHIDFGDCFEVAMQREKFPERVPFRLTRMLVSPRSLYRFVWLQLILDSQKSSCLFLPYPTLPCPALCLALPCHALSVTLSLSCSVSIITAELRVLL